MQHEIVDGVLAQPGAAEHDAVNKMAVVLSCPPSCSCAAGNAWIKLL